MAVRRLREGVRARDEPAVDEADERPEHHVLRECHPDRKPPLVDVDALPHRIERDAEQRTVQRMCTTKPTDRRPRPRNNTSE